VKQRFDTSIWTYESASNRKLQKKKRRLLYQY